MYDKGFSASCDTFAFFKSKNIRWNRDAPAVFLGFTSVHIDTVTDFAVNNDNFFKKATLWIHPNLPVHANGTAVPHTKVHRENM